MGSKIAKLQERSNYYKNSIENDKEKLVIITNYMFKIIFYNKNKKKQ